MKFLFLLFSFSLFACGTQKNTDSTELNDGQTTGVIVVSDACTFIQANIEGTIITMYPINLDPKFKKADLKISFDYAMSRGMQPTDCSVDKVISISNVRILKK